MLVTSSEWRLNSCSTRCRLSEAVHTEGLQMQSLRAFHSGRSKALRMMPRHLMACALRQRCRIPPALCITFAAK